MSKTLYRKYRPKDFSEIIGQSHIVRTLSNSVKNERIGHAYLFTGPRGTGKTSVARILAKTINCTDIKKGGFSVPCDKCPSCKAITSEKSLDILEIDAASNTGVDNIRELRETVALSTASLKYKVYIIDEVHMLSTGAWNALLKTLEEPPSHVVFILATTEIHKVPETIVSRCQRFDFARMPIADIIKKLVLIATSEKVKIEREALEMIAIAAEGGMRDAESLLDQIITLEDKNITTTEVKEILGTTDKKTVQDLARLILEKNSTSAVSKINGLLEDGYDLQVFNKSLVNYLRQLMLLKIDKSLKKHFSFEMSEEQMQEMLKLIEIAELPQILNAIGFFLEAQDKISAFILPQLPLEIAVIKATHTLPQGNVALSSPSVSPVKAKPPETVRQKPQKTPKKDDEINSSQVEAKPPLSKTTPVDLSDVKQNWNQMLIDIRPYNHSLSALLSNCQPTKVENNLITLATPYDFYRERLDDVKNKLTLEEVFSKILKSTIRLQISLDKSLAPNPKEEAVPTTKEALPEQDSLLDSALEIMGGKIVDE